MATGRLKYMSTIGLIDDRADHRSTLKRRLDLELSGDWQSIDNEPLPRLEDYPSWITENEVCVLLLDERLHEQVAVSYNGHDVANYLRKHLPTLPIFVITSYSPDEALLKSFKDVEDIIQREEFTKKADEYVSRFVRSAQRYLNTFQKELSDLSDKSAKIALGKATTQDIEEVKAIQEKIGLAFPYDSLDNRSEWLNALEKKLEELDELKISIEKYLGKS